MRPDTTDGASTAARALLDPLRSRIDRVLFDFLAERRAETVAMAPDAAPLVDEIVRLLLAGGKRIRPALCYWGYRATGSEDAEEILRPAAALELLHTFATIHDDVMDEAESRRGVEASPRFLAREGAPDAPDPAVAERFGRAAAVLVGDLCAALADELLLESAFSPDLVARAFRRYNRMRMEMAAGQLLDIGAAPRTDEAAARRVSSLKTGSYTIEGPLHVGAILGAGSIDLLAMLSRFGAPLGEAFQIRDDLEALVGGERGAQGGAELGGANMVVAIAARLATPAEREILRDPAARNPGDVVALVASTGAAFRAAELRDELVAQAREALEESMLPADALRALERVADLIASPVL
jgi:geranylgeranyl diphosphate synthase type I